MSNESFVFIQFCGGLGNQMFQYCAGYITAKILNTNLFVKEAEDNHHNIHNHNYISLLFRDASACDTPPGNYVNYYQKNHPFSSWSPYGIKAPCRLHGFFQYYPILEPFLPELIGKFRDALKVYHTTNTVFMHIRRGDFVEKSQIHHLQDVHYYYAAYKHLNKTLQGIPPKLLVVSDDIAWCKQQDWLQKIPNVSFYENENELDTLAQMASCGGGAIIANSTFSWWGAILSQTKYVYYPSKWIAIERVNNFPKINTLFPSHWVCIE